MIEMFFTLLGIQLFGALAGETFSIPVPGLVLGDVGVGCQPAVRNRGAHS